MLTRRSPGGRLLVALTLWAGLAGAGQSSDPPNWAQADLFDDWPCSTTPTAIPGLSVSLTTRGGPVLLMLTVNVVLPEGSSGPPTFDLEPVVDTQPVSADRLSSITNGQAVLTFSRAYPLTAGGHTFGARLQCPPFQTVVTRAWLTAYELPSTRR